MRTLVFWLLRLSLPVIVIAQPLVPAAAQPLEQRLKTHLHRLAEEIGERNLDHPESYKKAEANLTQVMRSYGYKVHRQVYRVGRGEVANLVAIRPGNTGKTLVVGAHYDTAHGTPGADDNASGCAALLELARLLKKTKKGPTLRLVFFANEEPEYFQTEGMGSLVYARKCAKNKDQLAGMLSLECIGYYSDQPQSQKFPVGITGYPDTGNFLGFVSDLSSKPLMERCLGLFKKGSKMPAEGLAAPSFLKGIGWSDHWSFWQCGYQAVMVTDTAPFRNPNYHAHTDRLKTVDLKRLAQVVQGLEQLLLNF